MRRGEEGVRSVGGGSEECGRSVGGGWEDGEEGVRRV